MAGGEADIKHGERERGCDMQERSHNNHLATSVLCR